MRLARATQKESKPPPLSVSHRARVATLVPVPTARSIARLNLSGGALTRGAQGSWGLREALAAGPGSDCPPLATDANADVVIVGGGFTGLWTAYFLTEANPNLGIVILEQDVCGAGPSGRNCGFASGWWDELDSLVALYGAEAAVRACRAISSSIDSIGEFCAAHGVDAWFQKAGDVDAATAAQHLAVGEHVVELAREGGAAAELRELTAAEVRARCDSASFRGGAFMRDGASVQPARLVRGPLRALLRRGVTMHEGTTATRLVPGPPAV